jgi:hypothetical protein
VERNELWRKVASDEGKKEMCPLVKFEVNQWEEGRGEEGLLNGQKWEVTTALKMKGGTDPTAEEGN